MQMRKGRKGTDFMRLDKYLADMGVGARSEIKKEIRRGAAEVNGTVIRDPGFSVPAEASVRWQGKPVAYESYVYYMMNKPAGVISATEDSRDTTVLDLIHDRKRKGLFPVGRLDRDTEGLVLITNDGLLAHRLLSPRHHVNKTYFVCVDGVMTDTQVRQFAAGLPVQDSEPFTALPAELHILPDSGGSEFLLTIQEGKYHQVKRMCAAVGRPVRRLKRISMGPLQLDPALTPGAYRRLTPEELQQLLQCASLQNR
jgi:16S rRNA pseudouridine516 synthase